MRRTSTWPTGSSGCATARSTMRRGTMIANLATSRWLVRPRTNPEARVRLVCLPHAGGGASLYRLWPEGLSPAVEVCAVQLPGRETRLREPAHRRVEPLVLELAETLARALEPPFALFGH